MGHQPVAMQQHSRAGHQSAIWHLTNPSSTSLINVTGSSANEKAAAELGISPETVQSHVKNVMHKLDADQCTLACANGDCQHAMPFDGMLPVETRDIVRRWISQGAQNN